MTVIASMTPGEPHCAKSRPRSSWSFAASITASCRRGRKCDGETWVRSPSRVKRRLWFDHEIDRGGDIIEFIKLERGCSFVDALDHARKIRIRTAKRTQARPQPRPRPTVDDDDDDEKRIEQALPSGVKPGR